MFHFDTINKYLHTLIVPQTQEDNYALTEEEQREIEIEARRVEAEIHEQQAQLGEIEKGQYDEVVQENAEKND